MILLHRIVDSLRLFFLYLAINSAKCGEFTDKHFAKYEYRNEGRESSYMLFGG